MVSESTSVFKLKISNIPSDWDKDALDSTFSDYGQVTGVHLIKLKSGGNLGYVSFSNYNEAKIAVDELDEKLPLELKVEFVNKDFNNQSKNLNSDCKQKRKSLNHVQSEKKLMNDVVSNCTPDFQSTLCSQGNKLFNKNSNKLPTFNLDESLGPYKDTNLMYTRGTVHINETSKERYVAYGTGNIYYRLPDPHCNIDTYIQNVVEKRERGLYKFCPKNSNENCGICNVCSSATALKCERCEINYYCSSKCQIDDWSKHKNECKTIPSLVKDSIIEPATKNSNHSVNFKNKKFDDCRKKEKYPKKVEKSSKLPKTTLSQQFGNKSKSTEEPTLPNIIEKLEVNSTGLIIFNALVGKGEYNVTLAPNDKIGDFESLLTDLHKELIEKQNWTPEIGEIICGEYPDFEESNWFRGKVLASNPIVMAAIDDGRIFVPLKIAPVPEKYSKMNSFGVTCRLLTNTLTVPQNKIALLTGDFTALEVSKSNGTASVNITIEDEIKFTGQAKIMKWNPKPQQIGSKCMPLINGQDVIITHFTQKNLVYVQGQRKEELDRFHLLEKKIEECAQNCIPLDEAPVVGQMVLAKFLDNENFYRAIVDKINESKVRIFYVDYGNEETTSWDKLFRLPKELTEFPSCVTKVKLNYVPDRAFENQLATECLSQFISDEEIFKCIFPGHPLDDGAVLMSSNQKSVNSTIITLSKVGKN